MHAMRLAGGYTIEVCAEDGGLEAVVDSDQTCALSSTFPPGNRPRRGLQSAPHYTRLRAHPDEMESRVQQPA
jgi:hypothetical protein